MGQATLGGLTFRLDPSSMAFGYSVKTAVTNTVNGRIIQVLGTKVNSLKLTGSCGVGGYEEHKRLVKNLIFLAERQLKDSGTPMKFTYPPEDWEFEVYLTAINGSGGGPALSILPGQTDWEFNLTLFVVTANADLKKAATDQFIKRFSIGIGWTPTEYNGIATYADLTAAQSQPTLSNFQAGTVMGPPSPPTAGGGT